jgi:hypothetical protein
MIAHEGCQTPLCRLYSTAATSHSSCPGSANAVPFPLAVTIHSHSTTGHLFLLFCHGKWLTTSQQTTHTPRPLTCSLPDAVPHADGACDPGSPCDAWGRTAGEGCEGTGTPGTAAGRGTLLLNTPGGMWGGSAPARWGGRLGGPLYCCGGPPECTAPGNQGGRAPGGKGGWAGGWVCGGAPQGVTPATRK